METWIPDMETRYGDLIWRPAMETRYGDPLWKPAMETRYGDPLWRPDMEMRRREVGRESVNTLIKRDPRDPLD